MPSGRLKWFGLAWALLAVGFASFLSPLNLPFFVRILRDEAKATGAVTRTRCDNHARVYYSFTVHRKAYQGEESMGDACRKSRPGDRIRVYFSDASPRLNVAVDPVSGLWNEIISILLVCLTFPPPTIWGFKKLWDRYRSREQSDSQQGD